MTSSQSQDNAAHVSLDCREYISTAITSHVKILGTHNGQFNAVGYLLLVGRLWLAG